MMPEDPTRRAPDPDEELDPAIDLDDDPMRALLKRSAPSLPPPATRPMLAEVQRRLRVRSKGKFYGDGWSTAQQRVSYALVAAFMILVVAIAYFALGPTGMSR